MSTTLPQAAAIQPLHADPHTAGKTRILLYYPDITLKGKNQKEFQNALYHSIKRRLDKIGYDWNIGASRGRACIIVPEAQQSETGQVATILQHIPGVYSLAVASWLHPSACHDGKGAMNWTNIGSEILALARQCYRKDASFAVRVHRVDKSLPITSTEMAGWLGDLIQRETDWHTVRLNKPDQTFYIDALPDGMYFYPEKLKGVGGLPVGTGGRVLALLSGGIDSPVAAFQLAKRGCQVDFFHLSASHLRQQDISDSVVGRLAAQLSQYTQRSRLYVVPYTYFDLALSGLNSGYELVLLRRFMMRAAERLAYQIRAQALVNGDSLGQVASQTLENLASSSSVVSMQILRPLIGANKDEIIALARQLGTYDISIEPYKDCCALIARNPKTKSRHDRLTQLEATHLPDYAGLLDKTFADMLCLEYRYGELVVD
ncbi:MAG: putative tRNA sulfurtransferase [Gammaproteobacteria bacterium]|nr:putative tRNA sulfurtransferase [Gammaproteobacteria bacterium]